MTDEVFLVQHVHEFGDGTEDVKIIGIYSTHEAAEAAVARTSRLEGFCDALDGFSIDRYELDSDNWREGYFTADA